MVDSEITKATEDVKKLFEMIMNFYWNYMESLENFMKTVPDTDTVTLNEMVEHMGEVQEALKHDISIFQKAIDSDMEDVQGVKDQLKINTIQDKLKTNG